MLNEIVDAIGVEPYFRDDTVVIYHADCRDILPKMPKVDLVLTDPPYGVERDKGFEGSEGFGGFGLPIARRQYADGWDGERVDSERLLTAVDAGRQAILFGGNFFADVLPQSTHWIVWDKLNTMPSFGDCELAWTNMPRKSVAKVTVEYNGLLGREATRWHPTQKPLRLMRWCIERYSEPSQTILDPFMGSGTTLRAAKDLGRYAVGIEIEEKYCEIAAKRMAQAVMNLSGGETPAQTKLGPQVPALKRGDS